MEFSFNHTTVCFVFSLKTNRGLHKCCYMLFIPPPQTQLREWPQRGASTYSNYTRVGAGLGISACGIVWFGQLPGPVFCTCQLFRSRSGLISSSCCPLPQRTSPTHHDRAELLTSSPNLPKHM